MHYVIPPPPLNPAPAAVPPALERAELAEIDENLIWKRAMEHSDEWCARQQAIQDEANRKRSEATRAQPRTEDGHRRAHGPA